MSMTRFVLAACFALLALPTWAQIGAPGVPMVRRPFAKPPAGDCPPDAATCEINVQVFDFGRGQMSPASPAIYGQNTISVTCTRSPRANDRDVDVAFVLKALPPEPNRYMRDSELLYLRYFMYVDPTRTRNWGDGSQGTFVYEGGLFLDNRNRVGTLVFPVYGKVDAGQTQTRPGQWLGAVVTRLEYQIAQCR